MIITCSTIINAKPEQLFALTQNYHQRQVWDNFSGHSRLINSRQPGKGAIVRTEAKNGLWMETEYIAYKPPKAACIRMIRGSPIFARFTGNWRFDSIDDSRCKVTFNYDLVANPAWLSWLLTPIIAIAFRHTTQKRLSGLKAYVEINHK